MLGGQTEMLGELMVGDPFYPGGGLPIEEVLTLDTPRLERQLATLFA